MLIYPLYLLYDCRFAVCANTHALNVPYHHPTEMWFNQSNWKYAQWFVSFFSSLVQFQMKTGMNLNVWLNGWMANGSCNVCCAGLCCVYRMNWNLNEESIKIKALIEWHRTDTVKLEIELTDNGYSNGDNRSHSAAHKRIQPRMKQHESWLWFAFIMLVIVIILLWAISKSPAFHTHTHSQPYTNIANLSVCCAHSHRICEIRVLLNALCVYAGVQ